MVDKPAGLVVHPAPSHRGPTLVDELGEILGGGEDPERPGIVHRLDKGTSGLLVVARDDEAHAALQAQVQRREVERVYLALAGGRLGSRTGTIDAPIGRASRQRHRMAVSGAASRQARTHFAVLELLAAETYLEARLETGRTHQIRAHFAAIGHPLTGDPTYGGARPLRPRAPVPARPPARLRPPAQRRARSSFDLGAARGPRRGAGGGRAPPERARPLQSAGPNQPPSASDPDPARRNDAGSRQAATGERHPNQGEFTMPEAGLKELLRGRSPLRPPDAPLEPEHAPLHLRRAGRDPHHRPAPDRGAAGERPPLRRRARQRRRHGALRRHQEAGPRLGQGMGRPLQDALRQPALAGRPADQLQHDVGADRPPARAHRLERGGQTRPAADQGADGDAGRARQARVQPRRRPRHGAPARRGLRHRPENRGDRGPRGGPPADPDHRPGRHQLRPDPGRLRDPRQRRRDPLLPAGDRHDRRRDRERRQRLAGAGGEAHRRGNGAAQKGGGRAQEARGGRESPRRGRGGGAKAAAEARRPGRAAGQRPQARRAGRGSVAAGPAPRKRGRGAPARATRGEAPKPRRGRAGEPAPAAERGGSRARAGSESEGGES